jgi:hypothetical protein
MWLLTSLAATQNQGVPPVMLSYGWIERGYFTSAGTGATNGLATRRPARSDRARVALLGPRREVDTNVVPCTTLRHIVSIGPTMPEVRDIHVAASGSPRPTPKRRRRGPDITRQPPGQYCRRPSEPGADQGVHVGGHAAQHRAGAHCVAEETLSRGLWWRLADIAAANTF